MAKKNSPQINFQHLNFLVKITAKVYTVSMWIYCLYLLVFILLIYRNSPFLYSKISSKKCSCKIIFGQTKLNENNFTSRRWALIEEITLRAEDMAGEKDIACCVRGHVYKAIWAAAIQEVLVCSIEPTNVGKIFVVNLFT